MKDLCRRAGIGERDKRVAPHALGGGLYLALRSYVSSTKSSTTKLNDMAGSPA